LSDTLVGDLTVQQVVQPTPVHSLYLIPAGKANGKAVLALAQERGKLLFDNLKEQYDLILVEAAPALEGVDALILGKHADAVIFSAQNEVSQVAQLQEAQQHLTQTGARVLGTILAGVGGHSPFGGWLVS
jgi:Mrp family chromosome partitioning ATPase